MSRFTSVKGIKIENVFFAFLIICNYTTYVLVSEAGFYSSAVLYHAVPDPENSFENFIILTVLYFILFCFIGIIPSKEREREYSKKRLNIIDCIFTIIILYNWSIFVFMGLGGAGTTNTSVGFLVNILPITPLMLIYYSSRNGDYNKHFYINLITGVLLPLAQGWSGILVSIFIIYILSKLKYVTKDNALKLAASFVLTLLAYKYIYSLKFFLRSGESVDVDFIIAAEYAISRVTAFQNFDFFVSITDQMSLYFSDSPLFYVREFLLALVPKFIFGLSNYQPIDNLFTVDFLASGDPDFDNSGFAITLPGLYFLAVAVNYLNIIVFPLFIVAVFFLIKRLAFFIWSEKIKYYLVYVYLSIFYSGNMRELAIQIYVLFLYVVITRICLYKTTPKERLQNLAAGHCETMTA